MNEINTQINNTKNSIKYYQQHENEFKISNEIFNYLNDYGKNIIQPSYEQIKSLLDRITKDIILINLDKNSQNYENSFNLNIFTDSVDKTLSVIKTNYIDSMNGECILIRGDITNHNFCKDVVRKTLDRFGRIDILINNAGVQYQQDKLENISDEQFDWTMKVNIYGMFYLTKEALPHMKSGSSIINLSSVTTFYGDPQLIDYVTTKGAIVGFTRSLARNLALKNIRVNAIAPGFFWTPLQPACWVKEKIPSLGSDAAMARGAMPYELAPTFVFLGSDDSSYMTGQVMHINGGQVMG